MGQPLFLFSLLAVVTAGLWASFYLGRAAKPRPQEPQRYSAQSRVPLAAEAMVAPLAAPGRPRRTPRCRA